MTAEAWYRLPGERQWVRIEQLEGEPEELVSCGQIGHAPGFVLAPFAATADVPVVLIRPDRISTGDVPQQTTHGKPATAVEHGDREAYVSDFSLFHAKLCDSTFDKLVLARCSDIDTDTVEDALQLFFRACSLYPQQFVALVRTARSGTWLMATPEVLLCSEGASWHTMALAGTISAECDDAGWTAKNRMEQQYVAAYVEQCLSRCATEIKKEGPYTVVAGSLKHLRTDFTFALKPGQSIGTLVSELHPTPAVCGLPKNEARQFILNNEHIDRRYYSGFAGPVDIGGRSSLFVTLRCMEVSGSHYRLYAGGGLLRESTAEQEWRETEAKLSTMKDLIR